MSSRHHALHVRLRARLGWRLPGVRCTDARHDLAGGTVSAGDQAVKGKCSVSFPLEGRTVVGATMDEAPLGGLTCAGAHMWEWYASLPVDRADTWCERHTVLKCCLCAARLHVRCNATRDRKCRPCAERHRKDIARVGRSGVRDRPDGFFFVTLTADGADRFPWDTDVCGHDASGNECGGDLGCVVDRLDA